jgi:hypothetical protein
MIGAAQAGRRSGADTQWRHKQKSPVGYDEAF